jgi:hypothetical protein
MLRFELVRVIARGGVRVASSLRTGMAPSERERLYECRASTAGG